MPEPAFEANVRTRRFNYTEVQPHFINPCCFGEDFAAWLAAELAPLAARGFEISEPIQEDYGWGLWVARAKTRIWIALSSLQDGTEDEEAPTSPPTEGEWVVTVAQDYGLNPLRRLFGGRDAAAAKLVATAVRTALEGASDITVSPAGGER
ncbi:MAG TPA: hypothetical protein VF363_01360 [Candidatus Eisenbacteria bacterium]